MKKLHLVILAVIVFTGISQAQMRNRSVWKSTAKPDTSARHEASAVSTEAETEPEDTSTANRIQEVVVTASRTEKKLDEVGRSVSVISAEDIKNSGANSLAELLNLAEGIYITGAGQNFGANQSLFMRGANSNQSVIMIDGIAISDPSTPTNALDLSELSLSEIDHVEIVRGSHSTLYGSSAIGGVINIITTKNKKPGLNIDATGTVGSFGKETSLIGQNIGMNYTFKSGLYANMNFSNENVNGIDATVDTSTVAGMPRDKDGMTRFDYGGRAGYKTKRWDINIHGRSTEKSADIDAREFTDDDNYTLDFERKLIGYSVTCNVDSNVTISVNGAHSLMTRNALNDSSLTDYNGTYDHSYYRGEYTGESFVNELQMNFRNKDYNIVIGGGFNDQMMSQNIYSYYPGYITETSLDTLDLASHTNNFFALADLKGTIISPKVKAFSLSLGARNNNNNTFGNSITYQVNPMVKVSSTSTIYANISSGYNAPSLYELYSPDKDFGLTISRGNVNLRPETSVTKEFGVYQKINDKTGMRLGFYKTVVTDMIEYVYLWDKNIPVSALTYLDYRGDTYLNLGTLTTEGIEMEAHGALGKKFLLSGNFSWLRGQQDYRASDIDTVKTEGNQVQLYNNGQFLTYKYRSNALTRRPVTANITLTYTPCTKVFFKAVLKYVSKRNDVYYDYMLGPNGALGKTPVQSYTLLDIISGVKFNQNISGIIRVENVFNISYSEIRGYSNRGRGFYLSVNYTF